MELRSTTARRCLSLLSLAIIASWPALAFAEVYGGGNFGGGNFNVGDLPAAAATSGGGGTQVVGSGPTAPGYVNTNPGGPASTTVVSGTVFVNAGASSTSATTTASAPAATSTPAPVATVFTRSLQYRDRDPEVRLLQAYLNAHGFPLASSGDGSSGQETDFFGTLTYRALVAFQTAHAEDILVPLGLTIGTGYFGPATIAFLNQHP